MLALPGAPFAVQYRELWLPRGINENASLPSSRHDGHGLTFTGARRGTTCDGVHFDSSATSNINCGAIHNASAKLVLSFRFKLDQPFAAGVASQYLWGKFLAGTDYIQIQFNAADGRLYFFHWSGGAQAFSLISAETSWQAGIWYHVLASTGQAIGGGAASNGARLRINNGTAVTSADVTAIPNGGDFVIGDRDDPGAGTGFKGIISDFFVMTDDITATEETDLYKGIPPADAVNAYPLDEGRGVTAYDRGSGGNNGTLDTSARWQFGQVEAPVISFDGINDRAATTALAVSTALPYTVIWVGKMKETYSLAPSIRRYLFSMQSGVTTISLYFNEGGSSLQWHIWDHGVSISGGAWAIDDYAILIGTSADPECTYYENGVLKGIDALTSYPPITATCQICYQSAPRYSLNKPLMVALIDGAFTQAQALTYSRYLQKVFNLPIII